MLLVLELVLVLLDAGGDFVVDDRLAVLSHDGVVRLELIWLALEHSRPSRSALMNIPFELSTSLMKIYHTQNDHEHLTNSKPPAQNQNGQRTFLTFLSHLRTLLTQDLANFVTLMLQVCRDEHILF
jgi:hypothetical protein